MKKHIRQRLQGADWVFYKDKLTMVCCSKNVNGHVKGLYKDPRTGFYYSHWLNDKEIEKISEKLLTKNQ